MKLAMWIVFLIQLIGTRIFLPCLPDLVPMHYNSAGRIDRWGSKYEMFLLVAITLIVTLIMHLVIKNREEKVSGITDEKEQKAFRQNTTLLGISGIIMNVTFCIIQAVAMYSAYRVTDEDLSSMPVDMSKLTCFIMGFAFIILGNFMPKTRLNGTIGLRVPWSMFNEVTWNRSNRFAGYAMVVAGIAVIITTLLVKSTFAAFVWMSLILGIALTAMLIYAHRVYVIEKALNPDKK